MPRIVATRSPVLQIGSLCGVIAVSEESWGMAEQGRTRGVPAGFSLLRRVAPSIRQGIVLPDGRRALPYATPYNFTGAPLPGYALHSECILTTKAAKALAAVQAALGEVAEPGGQRWSLVVQDCYRPQPAVDRYGW